MSSSNADSNLRFSSSSDKFTHIRKNRTDFIFGHTANEDRIIEHILIKVRALCESLLKYTHDLSSSH